MSGSGFNLVIAGAGFTGAALGLGLARAGARVLVVDKLPTPAAAQGDGRGLALNIPSIDLLTRLGLWRELAPRAHPIRHIHVTQQGHFGALRLSHRDLGLPVLGYVCPAHELQRVLLAALGSAPAAELRWSTSIGAVHPEAETLRVNLRTPAGALDCTTGLVIGADGIDSAVRELAGIGVVRRAYEQTAIVSRIEVAEPRAYTAFERFTTSGPLALLPVGGRRHVLVRSARTAEVPALLALSEHDYLADAQRRFGFAVGAFSALGPRRAHPLVLQRAARLTGPRMLLLGNAANTLHPNAAQGLNLGFRDVATALAILGDAVHAGDDVGSAAVLARYVDARQADQRATVRVTDTLARVFAVESPLVGSLRALALASADRLPWLKRIALQRLALGQGVWA